MDDDLRITKLNLLTSILDTRLKRLTKLQTKAEKEHGWNPSFEMYTKGSCPSVHFVCYLSYSCN
jgi:hypothetical protein